MRATAIMGDYLRARASLCEQRIDLRDGALLVVCLAAGGYGVKPRPVVARSRQVGGHAPNAGESVLVGHRLQVSDRTQLVSAAAATGVDELDATSHRLDLVSIEVALTAVTAAN